MAGIDLQKRAPFAGYAEDEKPLGSYALLVAAFNVAVGAPLVRAARSGRLPEQIALGDVVLLGVATHKLSRLVAKDTVTSWLRAPVVRYEGPG